MFSSEFHIDYWCTGWKKVQTFVFNYSIQIYHDLCLIATQSYLRCTFQTC
jgi:hypothetical protein